MGNQYNYQYNLAIELDGRELVLYFIYSFV